MNKQKSKNKSRKSSKGGAGRTRLNQKVARLMGEAPDQQNIRIGRNLIHNFMRIPIRPMPGARLSTRQITQTFSNSTGMSGNAIIQNSATSVLGAMAFTLADLANVSAFASLFDQYRIERVRLHVRSRSNAVSVFNTASPNAAVPTMYLCIDRDDSTAPAAVSDIMQYDSVVTIQGEEDAIIDLVPSITPAVFSGGAFSGYSSSPSNAHWIDIANTAVPHYGVKFGVTPLTVSTSSSWVWDVTAEFLVSFKNTR